MDSCVLTLSHPLLFLMPQIPYLLDRFCKRFHHLTCYVCGRVINHDDLYIKISVRREYGPQTLLEITTSVTTCNNNRHIWYFLFSHISSPCDSNVLDNPDDTLEKLIQSKRHKRHKNNYPYEKRFKRSC